jgi:hypothetical protein
VSKKFVRHTSTVKEAPLIVDHESGQALAARATQVALLT